MFKNKVLAGVALATFLTVGFGSAAMAQTVSTSISDWTTGSKSAARAASSASTAQTLTASNCVWSLRTGSGNPSPKQQYQLQKSTSGGSFASIGNSTPKCGTQANWGAPGTGSYRYQLNGIYDSSNSYHGDAGTYLFSASKVVIGY